MERQQAISLVEEALRRIKHPTPNAKGAPEQTGGGYWRLANVLENYLAPQLEENEGVEHARLIRETHGEIKR